MAHFVRVVAAVVLLASGGVALAGGDAGWPGYRGVGGDGVVAKGKLGDKLELTEVWKAKLGDSFGQIAVAGDTAVAFIMRGDDEFVVGLNAKTGVELWATRIDKSMKESHGDGPRSTPTINNGKIYVYSTHMKLACLNQGDGKVLWSEDIAGKFGGKEPNQWGNAVSPVVVDDVVIVPGSGKGKGILGLNKTSGEVAWSGGDEKLTQATPTVATMLGTKQVICFMQSGLVSVEPKSGEVLWKFGQPYSTSTAASPVVGGKDGDIVYCSSAYGVGAAACRVSKEGGKWAAKELWRTKGKNMNHWATPVYHDGYLYSLSGSNGPKGPLACIDIETGKEQWSQNGIGNQGGLILVGDKLLVTTPGGELVLAAASPEGYKELGRQKVLLGKVWTAPEYMEGMVIVRNNSDSDGSVGICLKVKE